MFQQLNFVGDSCKQIHTCVKQNGAYFEHNLFQFISDD